MPLDHRAVLGGADERNCSYNDKRDEGYLKRQVTVISYYLRNVTKQSAPTYAPLILVYKTLSLKSVMPFLNRLYMHAKHVRYQTRLIFRQQEFVLHVLMLVTMITS